jgi:hypothetical protein
MSREAGFPISATIRQKSRIAGLHGYQKAFGLRFDAVRVLLLAFVGWIAMPAAVGGGAWGEVPAHVYSYRVIHPIYGDIGSYTNIIENRGTETAVRNKFRVTVKILFAVAYEQKGDNSELWRDGRMVSFEGSMKKNGKRSKIRGYAQGDKFVIEGTRGKVVAPGNVFPNNPWVKSSEGDERVIDINGKTVKTRYFKVDGDARYELWFDETGVPVKFTDIGDDVTITYRLVRRTTQPIPRILKGGLTSP